MGIIGTGDYLPENLSPKPGDMYIVRGDRAYYCHTSGEWEVFGSLSTAATRIYYDTVVSGYNEYPLTEATLDNPNQSSAPYIVNNWASFTDCRWEVYNYTTGIATEHSFPTKDDFIAWKNANIPYSGPPDLFTQQINVKPYDVLDGLIPVVDRMYGVNNFYAGMKGGHYKASFPNHLGDSNFASAILYDIWAHFWPSLAGVGFFPTDFIKNATGRQACWTSRNYTKMYSMPRVGEVVRITDTPSGVGYRKSANENWEGFNNVVTTDLFLHIMDRVIVVVNEGGTSWDLLSSTDFASAKLMRQRLLSRTGGYSAFVAFMLASDALVGERQIAVLIKPMGIDRIWLPYFNTSLYDLEVVYMANQDIQPCFFRKVSTAEFNAGSGSTPHPNSGFFLKKSAWIDTSGSRFGRNLVHTGGSNRIRTYFRLRDKNTKRVGRLSAAHIELRLNETNAPVKLMVRQDRY